MPPLIEWSTERLRSRVHVPVNMVSALAKRYVPGKTSAFVRLTVYLRDI
jgi:hypothetical protein